MKYPRPPGAGVVDYQAARAFEDTVGGWLGSFKIGNLNSPDKMDWWVPGFYLDVKERKRPVGPRWPLPEGCRVEDAFILDELSIRRAMQYFPHAYFLLRALPEDRVFLARIDEVLCADRTRVNRVGPTGHPKGKHILNLQQFRMLEDPETELMSAVLADQIAVPWKRSDCLIDTNEEDEA